MDALISKYSNCIESRFFSSCLRPKWLQRLGDPRPMPPPPPPRPLWRSCPEPCCLARWRRWRWHAAWRCGGWGRRQGGRGRSRRCTGSAGTTLARTPTRVRIFFICVSVRQRESPLSYIAYFTSNNERDYCTFVVLYLIRL